MRTLDEAPNRKRPFFLCVRVVVPGLLLSLLLTSGCYSVRLQTTTGIPMPDPINERTDFYRNMLVIEKDTVIRLGALEKEFTLLIKDCESGALHTVEYRNTFGGLLLSAITFGKRRKVKIKYVCIKPSN